MKFIELDNKNVLDDFLLKQDSPEFLQSWEWGDFQIKTCCDVLRYGVLDANDQLIAAITLIKKRLFGSCYYFYSPRGPILDNEDSGLTRYLFESIKKLAKEHRCLFLRFEPDRKAMIFGLKAKRTVNMQPAKTLVVDLRKSEEQLLSEMHQKTRYNINLARKKGVVVEEGDIDSFDNFWNLMKQTGKRDHFRTHEREYYETMVKSLSGFMGDRLNIKLYFARFDDELISASLVVFFDGTATYLHGASSNKHRNVMAPYLLQWEVIKQAKEIKCERYDFFGIDEKKWPGVTRFKNGFCSKSLEESTKKHPGTFDIAFKPARYNIYKMLRAIKRLI